MNIKKTDMLSDMTSAQLKILETPLSNLNIFNYTNANNDIININFVSDYVLVKKYMSSNMEGYRTALKNSTITNQTVVQYINSILDAIDISTSSNPEIISDYQNALTNAYNYEVSKKNYVVASKLDDCRLSEVFFFESKSKF